MFCPVCRDEYRAGFTHCATCDVELVERLDGTSPERAAPTDAPRISSGALGDFCGFLTMDEAKQARDRLREAGIRSEIAVRDAADAPEGEEYWLRVDVTRVAQVDQILGYDPAEPAGEAFECGACGRRVDEDETSCPHCGARFDD